jgi:hypothetical protein
MIDLAIFAYSRNLLRLALWPTRPLRLTGIAFSFLNPGFAPRVVSDMFRALSALRYGQESIGCSLR